MKTQNFAFFFPMKCFGLEEKNQDKFRTMCKVPSFECTVGHLAKSNLAA